MGDVDDVQMMEYGGRRNFQNEDEEEEDRVLEWEDGLPNTDDLTPLSQYMITSELASAFQITPEPYRSMNEVNRASQTTLTSIRKHKEDNNNYKCSSLVNFSEDRRSPEDPVEGGVDEYDDDEETEIMMKDGSESRKSRRIENTGVEDAKRPRLVWTPQLHKRFVDVVGHLGIKSAVPKTIMQMMNVEGLTRENVASHLQKYRLYLKRMMQGGLSSTTNEAAPSSSDPLFATTTSPPVPQNHHELSSSTSNGRRQGNNNNVPIRSMPMMMVQGHHMGTSTQEYCGGNSGPSNYHGFQSHQYNMLREQQREWSGHMFNSMSSSYPYVNPNDK